MSTYTNQTFQLHTHPMNQSEAQATCNRAGGNLASYSLLEEQAEVEQAYVDMVGGRLCCSLSSGRPWRQPQGVQLGRFAGRLEPQGRCRAACDPI
jgi:hypothetical protein